MNNLNGKIALITGASGGLGASVTNAYLAAGARVIGVSRSIKAADFRHPNFTALPAELNSLAAAHRAVAAAVAQFGRIDALVHLIGAFAGGQSVAETDDATMDKMLQLNFLSAFHILRAVIPGMRTQKAGRIVVVASRQGVEPAAMLCAYNASKAALVSLVKTVALENKDAGITANAVLPGGMATPANQGSNLIPTELPCSFIWRAMKPAPSRERPSRSTAHNYEHPGNRCSPLEPVHDISRAEFRSEIIRPGFPPRQRCKGRVPQ